MKNLKSAQKLSLGLLIAISSQFSNAAGCADGLSSFLQRAAQLDVRGAANEATQFRSQLINNLAKSKNVPAFIKMNDRGEELPVILVNRDSYAEVKEYLDNSMGTQIFLQPNWNNDHGSIRTMDRMIDVDTPGARGYGEMHQTGIAWKGLESYVPRRKDDASVILEVSYALRADEKSTVDYYHRMRRAAIVRVPFTFGRQNPNMALANMIKNAGEHCFVYCKGSNVDTQIRGIEQEMKALGVQNLNSGDAANFMNLPEVKKFLEAAKKLLLKANPNDERALSPNAFADAGLVKILEPVMPAGISPLNKLILGNWIVGLDASRSYRQVLRDLEVSSDMAVGDMNNRRATAVLVWDAPSKAAAFKQGTYETPGKFYSWTNRGQRAIAPVVEKKTFSPAEVLLKKGLNPKNVIFRQNEVGQSIEIDVTAIGNGTGFIRITDALDEAGRSAPIIELVELDENLKGKGVGTLLYLAAARLEYERSGRLLRMSALSTSDAKAVWQRLEEAGFATKTIGDRGDVSYVFSEDALKSEAVLNTVDFVRQHTK